MRILIVAPIFPPATGGCATYFNILTKRFKRMDEIRKVTILTGRVPGAPLSEKDDKVKVLRLLPWPSGPLSRIGWIFWEIFGIPISLFFTFWVTLFTGSDILHVHKTKSLGGAVIAGKFLGRPVIGDVRDLHDPALFRLSDLFIVCGLVAMEKMKEVGLSEEKMVLVPVPFELEAKTDPTIYNKLAKGPLKGKRFILFIGDVGGMKGVPELLKGYRSLRKKKRNIDLVLVGKNLMGEDLDEGSAKKDGVHVLGPLSHPQAMGLLKHAEVLILPSKFEVFPRTCIEGVILGRKVIFPPMVPEFRKQVGGFVLKEISAGAISSMLEKVVDSDERSEYPIEKHDADTVSKRVLRIYKRSRDGA